MQASRLRYKNLSMAPRIFHFETLSKVKLSNLSYLRKARVEVSDSLLLKLRAPRLNNHRREQNRLRPSLASEMRPKPIRVSGRADVLSPRIAGPPAHSSKR